MRSLYTRNASAGNTETSAYRRALVVLVTFVIETCNGVRLPLGYSLVHFVQVAFVRLGVYQGKEVNGIIGDGVIDYRRLFLPTSDRPPA